jgi:hypothetical protein
VLRFPSPKIQTSNTANTLKREKSHLAAKPNAVAWVFRLKVHITRATFALLLVRLLSAPQTWMYTICSLASSSNPLHHQPLLMKRMKRLLMKRMKRLLPMMSVEDVQVLITAVVLHTKNLGLMSAKLLELAAQHPRKENSCASMTGTQKDTLHSNACLMEP